MTQSNNDIEELEELLTELEGQEAQLVRPYTEDDDAVTRLMDAPLGDQEWMVQVTALDRRMMSQDQVLADLRAGKLSNRTLVWQGGMDDWLPIARVEGLSRAAAAGSFPPGSLPAPSATRLAAPAPLPAPPMWSQTMPSAAPLPPPPPAALPALAPMPSMASSGLPSSPMNGMPMSRGLPAPAAAPLPPPPSSPSLPPPDLSSGTNTARPVAIDFSDMVEEEVRGPLRGKRAVMALSAVAILAVFISAYAMLSKSDGTTASAEPSRAEQPRAVAALQPSSAEKKGEPVASAAAVKPAEPPAAAKPSEPEPESEASESSSSSARTAPARYSPRSEYRRRSRSSSASERSSDEPEASEAPAAEVASRAVAPAPAPAEDDSSGSEQAVVADDDADAPEAPKSTGKPANTFNREAAKSALDDAAGQAKNCRPAGGPSGTGRVQVRYEPSGKVSSVSILTSKFENTTTGSCVKMLFRRAKVPEFTGAPVVVVNKSFEIP